MGVKMIFQDDVKDKLTRKVAACLMKTGEDTVRQVRDRDAASSWKDHTGNLRSSVGYAVYVNGQETQTGGFNHTTAPEGDGSDGQRTGEEALEALGAKGRNELVVVAGMDYASDVEAKGYDVLASGELFAKAHLSKNLGMIRIS